MSRFLIIALGNPGEEYQLTRHNAGWFALDQLLEKWNDPSIPLVWKNERKIQSLITKIQYAGHEIIAIKPQTFMNRSGEAVKAALQWYNQWDAENPAEKIPNLVVIHDDLDIELGKYKLKFGSGPQIHNGVNNIRSQIHTDQFWYARLGIDGRLGDRSIPGEAYVLQKLSPQEKVILKQSIDLLADELFYLVFP